MTRSRILGILIVVASLVVLLFTSLKIQRQKSIVEIPAQDNGPLELPGMKWKPSRTASSTRAGWDVYTSEELNIQLEIPSSWRRREYTDGVSNDVIAVAFDPLNVVTQHEYVTFDQSAGRVLVRREPPYAWYSVMGLTKVRNIGPEQISVRYSESDPTVPASNPAWVGMASEKYYSTSNTVPVSIEFAYPVTERQDAKKREVLEQILESVRSAREIPSTSQ